MKSFTVNWKTTLAGVGMILLGGLDFLGYGPNGTAAAMGEIMAGIGLLFAKDGNVTGGTVPQ